MTGRIPSDTPDFDRNALSQLGEDGTDRGGDNKQPDGGGDNRQPTQIQPDANAAIDDVINRTDRPAPQQTEQQQQQKKPEQQKPPQQQQQKGLIDENGQPVPQNVRHHFIARKNAERALTKSTQELAEAKGQLQAYAAVHQAMQQSGLSAQEQATALAIGSALKKDPVAAVKQLLTELKSAGINIDGAIGVNTIDTASIASLIDQKLAPFTQQQNERKQQQQQQDEISSDVGEFFDEFPDAQLHASHLNVLLQRNPNWTLDRAWFEFQLGMQKNGLDLSQPLDIQIAAIRNKTQNRSVNNGVRVPMTSGGRGGANNQQPATAKSFDHNAQTRDIVLDSLREAGVDVSRLS